MYYRNHKGSMALDDQCFVAIVGPAYGRSCCFWKTVRFACRQLLPTPEAGGMTQTSNFCDVSCETFSMEFIDYYNFQIRHRCGQRAAS